LVDVGDIGGDVGGDVGGDIDVVVDEIDDSKKLVESSAISRLGVKILSVLLRLTPKASGDLAFFLGVEGPVPLLLDIAADWPDAVDVMLVTVVVVLVAPESVPVKPFCF